MNVNMCVCVYGYKYYIKCVAWVESTLLNVTDPDLCVSVLRYQEELPTLISNRADKHVTQSELVKLMEWKLTVSNVETPTLNTPEEI